MTIRRVIFTAALHIYKYHVACGSVFALLSTQMKTLYTSLFLAMSLLQSLHAYAQAPAMDSRTGSVPPQRKSTHAAAPAATASTKTIAPATGILRGGVGYPMTIDPVALN